MKNYIKSIYRTHTCGELSIEAEKNKVILSGWVHRKRDHGAIIFIDLRDHYGITQVVVEPDSPFFLQTEHLKNETVIRINGIVLKRSTDTINVNMTTGAIEVQLTHMDILSESDPLPLPVNSDQEFPEETRLRYRFLDLRREKLHHNIVLRSQVISYMRQKMIDLGFLEFQTPILTCSSPEGARDYLVPSRLHPGCFYALPQAPQQFKQLLMVAGFDRYFQIAPCFRDEDARADRSPGEFYQLDIEMAFVEQEDIFNIIEPLLTGLFEEFSKGFIVTRSPYPRITYDDAMLQFGSDKPDLRNPIRIFDVTDIFKDSLFSAFVDSIQQGYVIRAIPAPQVANKPRSFFEKLNSFGKEVDLPGLGYILFEEENAKGPIAKFLNIEQLQNLREKCRIKPGDALFFICETPKKAPKLSGLLRDKLGEELDLIEKNAFRFCWVVDYPMYEQDEETGKIDFSHNPFSMPKGGLEALLKEPPLSIKANQYDIVCNGIELSSGAIRNHIKEVMIKAFEIAGYTQEDVEKQFSGMLNAFRYGAPPHGGCAPGIDRIVMLLAHEPNIREVIAFPFNQKAQDLLMDAPSEISDERLKELHIKRVKPIKVS
jgi:aspartyl-tRNA synthetase